ncbi:hypothetical protein GCM10028864_38210 [Microlunatus parietis]
MRVGDGGRPADQGHRAEVVHVVAEIGHVAAVDAALGQPGRQGADLVVDALQVFHAELGGAGRHDRVAFLGQDQDRDLGPAQFGDAVAVAAADPDRLVAVLVDVGGVGGVYAVEVGDQGPDADQLGARRVDQAGQRLGHDQLLRGVDLHRGQLGHLDHSGPAEEAVLVGPEAGHLHDVEGAGLAEVGPPVLPPGPYCRVVVLADHGAAAGQHVVGPVAPDEVVRRDAGERAVAVVVEHQRHPVVEVVGLDERAGALDEDEHVRLVAGGSEFLQRVQQRRLRAGQVTGDGRRPLDHAAAGGAADLGDLRVVRADVHGVDEAGPTAGRDRAGDQRHPADPAQVLARYALGAASGRDDRDDAELFGGLHHGGDARTGWRRGG